MYLSLIQYNHKDEKYHPYKSDDTMHCIALQCFSYVFLGGGGRTSLDVFDAL